MHSPIPENPEPIEQVTIRLPDDRLAAAAMIVAVLTLIACVALAG